MNPNMKFKNIEYYMLTVQPDYNLYLIPGKAEFKRMKNPIENNMEKLYQYFDDYQSLYNNFSILNESMQSNNMSKSMHFLRFEITKAFGSFQTTYSNYISKFNDRDNAALLTNKLLQVKVQKKPSNALQYYELNDELFSNLLASESDPEREHKMLAFQLLYIKLMVQTFYFEIVDFREFYVLVLFEPNEIHYLIDNIQYTISTRYVVCVSLLNLTRRPKALETAVYFEPLRVDGIFTNGVTSLRNLEELFTDMGDPLRQLYHLAVGFFDILLYSKPFDNGNYTANFLLSDLKQYNKYCTINISEGEQYERLFKTMESLITDELVILNAPTAVQYKIKQLKQKIKQNNLLKQSYEQKKEYLIYESKKLEAAAPLISQRVLSTTIFKNYK